MPSQSLRRRDAGEVGAWIWKAHFEHVTCFSDEKIFRIDAVAPGRSCLTLYRGKQGRRNNATPLFGIHQAKRGRGVVAFYVGPLWSHFSRHIPPRSGLPLHGQCSPRCCVARSLTRFVAKRLHFVGFGARFKVHRLCNLVCVLICMTSTISSTIHSEARSCGITSCLAASAERRQRRSP